MKFKKRNDASLYIFQYFDYIKRYGAPQDVRIMDEDTFVYQLKYVNHASF